MMATGRRLSAITRSGVVRRRLAVAAGSLAAVSATASAFLADPPPARANGSVRQPRQQEAPAARELHPARPLAHDQRTSESGVRSELRPGDDTDGAATMDETVAAARALSETLRRRFRVGDSYVWLYRDVDGNPTSWEKYTVSGVQEEERSEGRPGFLVTIEMSTKFDEDEAYQTHHRIKADLVDNVMESPDSRDAWRIGFEFFHPDKGTWKTFGKGNNVQAFEEKFDVFSMVSAAVERAGRTTKGGAGVAEGPRDECLIPLPTVKALCATEDRNTRTASLVVQRKGAEEATRQTAELTQTERHGYTGTWYGPPSHDALSGIALYKEFPTSGHSFSLIERSTGAQTGAGVVTDAIAVVVVEAGE